MLKRNVFSVCLCLVLIICFTAGASATTPLQSTYVKARVGHDLYSDDDYYSLSDTSQEIYLNKGEEVQLQVEIGGPPGTVHCAVYRRGILEEEDELVKEETFSQYVSTNRTIKVLESGWYYVTLKVKHMITFLPTNGTASLGHLKVEGSE